MGRSGDTFSVCKGEPEWQPSRRHSPNLRITSLDQRTASLTASPTRSTNRSPSRSRVKRSGNAGGQRRVDVSGDGRCQSRFQSAHLLVEADHFEKSDSLHQTPTRSTSIPITTPRTGRSCLRSLPPERSASITGSVDDAWQTAIEDVGPAGIDKGKGGKYAILPPGYKDKLPEGYIPMQSADISGFAILRSNLKSGSKEDIAKAVNYGKEGIKVYPLSQAANPPETKDVRPHR